MEIQLQHYVGMHRIFYILTWDFDIQHICGISGICQSVVSGLAGSMTLCP